jgi:hypothetical protein
METSLQRSASVELERHLYRNFRKYARTPGEVPLNDWDWLAVAQHHALPTRVLDWTFSPLVALHFATWDVSVSAADGVVWSVDVPRVHGRLPDELKQLLRSDGSEVFTTNALARAEVTPFNLTGYSESDFFLFLEPPSIDDRVVNQFASLTVGSNPSSRFDDWLEGLESEVARRLVIPSSVKAEAREKLDQANINERVLFPGLDGLSKWLTRYYTTGVRDWIGQVET